MIKKIAIIVSIYLAIIFTLNVFDKEICNSFSFVNKNLLEAIKPENKVFKNREIHLSSNNNKIIVDILDKNKMDAKHIDKMNLKINLDYYFYGVLSILFTLSFILKKKLFKNLLIALLISVFIFEVRFLLQVIDMFNRIGFIDINNNQMFVLYKPNYIELIIEKMNDILNIKSSTIFHNFISIIIFCLISPSIKFKGLNKIFKNKYSLN